MSFRMLTLQDFLKESILPLALAAISQDKINKSQKHHMIFTKMPLFEFIKSVTFERKQKLFL